MKHIKTHHKSVNLTINDQQKESTENDCQRIDAFISSVESMQSGGLSDNFDQEIAWWVIWNSLPFRVVEQKGFKDIVKTLNNNYSSPSRNKLENIICKLYEVKSNQMRTFLDDVKWLALTADGWKDIKNQISYVGVTLHFIDNYQMMSICIKANQFTGEATAERIESVIRQTCDEFAIDIARVVSITTDAGANYKKAGKNIAAHIHCVAHCMNRVVEDGLENSLLLSDTVENVRNIVTAFKQSSILMDSLRNHRLNNEDEPLKLILRCCYSLKLNLFNDT
ncbi:uncharacterized protein LOC107370709 [Tetranychus urticae]|uniref:uncharacterized protein LOC107370709 n=1 Tax=Tetranychus urticae TaxID=32264 RepID=UPI00077BC7C3|nr:uncharacterized protein LOC107370709 [Tetranychus urticae]